MVGHLDSRSDERWETLRASRRKRSIVVKFEACLAFKIPRVLESRRVRGARAGRKYQGRVSGQVSKFTQRAPERASAASARSGSQRGTLTTMGPLEKSMTAEQPKICLSLNRRFVGL